MANQSSDIIQQQPTFDPNKIEPGAVIRVTSQLFPTTRNSYAWNALVVKVEPFELTVARLPGERERSSYDDGDVMKQRIHIEAVVKGDATVELLRRP
jgi:hypothetical protein